MRYSSPPSSWSASMTSPSSSTQIHQATLALTDAVAASSEDRMLVPEALSQSIRHLFVFYLVAGSCERQCDDE